MGNTDTAISHDIQSTDGIVKSVLIAIPITRQWAVEMQVKQMVALNRFTDVDMHVLFFIDNQDVKASSVEDRIQYHEMTIPYTIHNTRRKAPQEVRIYHRRDRIKEMLTLMQQHIKAMPQQFDMLFMVEDDTEIQSDTLQRLLSDYKELSDQDIKVGFIEGVQVGRHGIRMIGAWRCDDINDPKEMSTIPFNTSSFFEKIDGGGLYCFITPMHLFLAHEFYWHDECFSVDVTYGLELRKKGFTNLIDWTVVTGHVDQHGNNFRPNENCTVARYLKSESGEWKLQSEQERQTS